MREAGHGPSRNPPSPGVVAASLQGRTLCPDRAHDVLQIPDATCEPINAGGRFAEFETNLRRERQLEGIAKAKAAGVYKGRPASIDAAKVRELKAQGLGPSQIAKALNIGRASVYRVLEPTTS
jgi:hypothetical protein